MLFSRPDELWERREPPEDLDPTQLLPETICRVELAETLLPPDALVDEGMAMTSAEMDAYTSAYQEHLGGISENGKPPAPPTNRLRRRSRRQLGDSGSLYYCIPTDDLATGRYDRVCASSHQH